MPSSGCLCLSLPAIRPPEELTLSPKLQLDGSLTMSSSGGSSLQASPRSLLPSLLPGPADKLTPKGPGQVRECEMQVSRCITSERSEQSSPHSTLSAYPVLPQVAHISLEVISAFYIPCRAAPQLIHSHLLSS